MRDAPSKGIVQEMRPPPALAQTLCQQLRGDEYMEYILRTLTRSLGGVSPVRRACIIRDLFPYKPFPPVDKAPSLSQDNGDHQIGRKHIDKALVRMKYEVPVDGNKHVETSKWTPTELAKHDGGLRGWARWEVDYGAKVVRSTKCEKMTTDKGGICSQCLAVAKDESFKSDVRKVRNTLLSTKCCDC